MSGSEEEYYSTLFVALKHSIRRKIIRMLHEKPRSFSKMLDELKIESSHLTYHLETLGDLLHKTEDGKYALSFLGEAAMSMMYHVEETPKARWHFPKTRFKLTSWFSLLLAVLFVFTSAFYFYYRETNKLQAEYDWTNEILSNTVFSAYSDDIGAAVQRWRAVHGNAFEGGEILPCYINTGAIAAWIDPEGNLQLESSYYYGPQYQHGGYWCAFPYPTWCRPPEIIAVWVQLYNRSSNLWYAREGVLDRETGSFACYLVNRSHHRVIGIDGYYAVTLFEKFWHNSFPEMLGTHDYKLTEASYGMRDDGSWEFNYRIQLKYTEEYRDVKLLVNWKTENVEIETWKSETDQPD